MLKTRCWWGDVARLSRDLNIDIAVDLKGFTRDARTGIFAHRAAPIQVNYLGYPGTMGADYIDYIIADKTIDEVVLARVDEKRSVMESLMEAMKR